METTKICKECGKELPLDNFSRIRGGMRISYCKSCVSLIRKENKAKKDAERAKKLLYFDSLFDGKQPVEILKLMWRGKKWLESRGYEIHLSGSLTVKKDIEFSKL